MKVRKILCTVCDYNFATEGLFFAHRVGPSHKRRCLWMEEMALKGWVLERCEVKEYSDGHPVLVKRFTWMTPEYRANYQRMSEFGKQQSFGRNTPS
jgi:hypothetical protein